MLSIIRLSTTTFSRRALMIPRQTILCQPVPIGVRLHTSSHRLALPLPVVIKTLMKPTAAFTGRYLRRWWQALPEKTRLKYKRRFLKSRRGLAALLGVGWGLGFAYYVYHLEYTPITGRRRFVSVSKDILEAAIANELDTILDSIRGSVLPPNHRYTRRIVKLVSHLSQRNADIEAMKRKWKVMVIPNDNLVNAMCFPTGEVLVFTGLLKFVENDDQLAFILAHEMSHVLLEHGRELVSYSSVLDWLIICLVLVVWTVMPSDTLAVLGHWVQGKLVDICLHLPYSRKLEQEADNVGLEMTAKACFDIREAGKFWELMDIYEETQGAPPEFLSTHPASIDRAKHIYSLLSHMLNLRRTCGCHELDRRLTSLHPSSWIQSIRGKF